MKKDEGYYTLDLAKYIVTKCVNDDCPISNVQLQAILYFIQIDFLQRDDFAFFDDFDAVAFGPKIPQIYYYFCGSGGLPILDTYDNLDDSFKYDVNINRIIEENYSLKSWELISKVQKSRAWQKTWDNGKGAQNIIPIKLMKDVG